MKYYFKNDRYIIEAKLSKDRKIIKDIIKTLDYDIYLLIDYRLLKSITINNIRLLELYDNIISIDYLKNNKIDKLGIIISNDIISNDIICKIVDKNELLNYFSQSSVNDYGEIINIYKGDIIEYTSGTFKYPVVNSLIVSRDIYTEYYGDNRILTIVTAYFDGDYEVTNYLLQKWN